VGENRSGQAAQGSSESCLSNAVSKPEHAFRRSEAFFGRRKAKSLSAPQQKLLDELLPEFRLDVNEPTPQNLTVAFPHKPEQIVLESGFGGGEHLIHQALANPDTGFIGVEPFVNSMAKALVAIDDNKIQNIRLYDEDATGLLDWLPENCIDRIDLLYPDPWPKKKHWKRRFVNQKNLTRFSRVLKSGAAFHFASDIETYINWTLNHCHKHPDFQWQATSADDWWCPYENWTRTRYEAKAIRENRTPCYLRFSRI